MTGCSAVEATEADLVSVVERRREEGLSVAAACREAGISTSTYYRRRRAAAAAPESDSIALRETPPATVGLLSGARDKSWPFAGAATAAAPFYWDQVFVEELSDSFVRREFGSGPTRAAPRALTAIAAPGFVGTPMTALRRLYARLPIGMQPVAAPVAGALFFALIVSAAMLTVSVAADPAAWINPTHARVAASEPPPPTP